MHLLFLNDAGSSLQGAWRLLNFFSEMTGLEVNWSKSTLFAIDPAARSSAPPDVILQWVDQFTYLGVKVTRDIDTYIPLNLTPVVEEAKAKLKAWENLPLSLFRRHLF